MYIHVRINVYMYIYVYICVYMYVYLYIYMYVCMYVCMYICTKDICKPWLLVVHFQVTQVQSHNRNQTILILQSFHLLLVDLAGHHRRTEGHLSS